MSRETEFIKHLRSYCEEDNVARAELAVLRRGASGEDRDLARVYPLVLPHAPRDLEQQQAYIDVACLFGLHPTKPSDVGRAVTLAEVMRQLSEKSDSIEARFVALLQCHRDELLVHLRHAVGLARSNDIPLRWDDILRALLRWDEEPVPGRRTVQQQWAQEFWAPYLPREDREAPGSDVTTTP